jgi:group I intron endonuclease
VQRFYYVYLTTNTVTGKIYVGQRARKWPPEEDGCYLGSGVALKDAIRKYGRDKFTREVIQICHSQEELNNAEIALIALTNAMNPEVGYNLTEGGSGTSGYKLDPVTAAKIKRNFGDKNPTFGKPRSEEVRRKISQKLTGRVIHSAEARAKMSRTRRGKPKWPKIVKRSGLPRYIWKCVRKFRVGILGKDYGVCETVEEAVARRDEALKALGISLTPPAQT